MEIIIGMLILVMLDLFAVGSGADSGDSVNSSEWSNRRNWRGFGGSTR